MSPGDQRHKIGEVPDTERRLVDAVLATPQAREPRVAYSDWLEQRGDPRAEFLRVEFVLRSLDPDHVGWTEAETLLSRLRAGLDADWVSSMTADDLWPFVGDRFNPISRHSTSQHSDDGSWDEPSQQWASVELHRGLQDTESAGWKRLVELIDEAAADKRLEFDPGRDMTDEEWQQIVTLPASIAKLKHVRTLHLYGSWLLRIPPEIGQMEDLENFVPYTSDGLHWFPYEITRCHKLVDSTVSTRKLYGSYSYRTPFPRLDPLASPDPLWSPSASLRSCSVCETVFEDCGLHRVWISLWVATDVLPLLVNACSEGCVDALPKPPDGYVPGPHKGGLDVTQPDRQFGPPQNS